MNSQETDAESVQSVVRTELEIVIAFVEPTRNADRAYNNGHVLFAKGSVVEFEMSMQGRNLEEWLIDEVPADGCVGILVWEGECDNRWCMNHGADWEPRLRGRWRKPTAIELWSLVPQTF